MLMRNSATLAGRRLPWATGTHTKHVGTASLHICSHTMAKSTMMSMRQKSLLRPSSDTRNRVNNLQAIAMRLYATNTPRLQSKTSNKKLSKKEEARLKQAAKDNVNKRTQGGGIEGDIIAKVANLTKVIPGPRKLFEETNLSFLRGAKIGVLGLNGSGKSSFFRILAGLDKDYDGQVWIEDTARVGYLDQNPELDPNKSVHENIMDGLKEKTDLLGRFDGISMQMADPDADFDKLLQEQADVQHKIDALDCWNLNHMVESAKAALRVPPDTKDVSVLSGGEKRRVALCRLLLEHPDFLLLDEPTNHLDAESVNWLENFLKDYKGTVIAVTHDRYFLDNVAGWILEIDRGRMYPYAGNYSTWLYKKAERLEQEEKSDKRKQAAIQEEMKWLKQGTKGQQSKSKSRISAFEKMNEQAEIEAQSRKFLSGAINIPSGPRLGRDVLKVKDVTCQVTDASEGSEHQRILFKNLSFEVPRGAIVGVVGGNGVGKTTLMRMISGELHPHSGSIELGSTVKLGFASQARDDLDDNAKVMDAVSDGSGLIQMGNKTLDARAYLAGFNLKGDLALKPVKSLSGGERNRVHLARVLSQSSNFLILDEPTNDLDVDTLRSLENAIEGFNGCAMIVSHDRYFLDRVSTHTLAFKDSGEVEFFYGSWSEFERERGAVDIS